METKVESAVNRAWNGALRLVFRIVLTGFLFGALAFVGMEWTREGGEIPVVWLPNALAIAYLLRAEHAREDTFVFALWAGNCTANLLQGDAAIMAAALAFANAVEIAIAVLLTRRLAGARPDMRELSELMLFAFAAVVCAPLVSAALAATALAANGAPFIASFARWAVTHALAVAVIAPACVILADVLRHPPRPRERGVFEWLVLTICGAALTWFAFDQTQLGLAFLVPSIVIAHAVRLGSLATALFILTVAAIATVFTGLDNSPATDLLVLTTFLASVTLCGLPIAATLNSRSRIIAELSEGKRRLKVFADNVTDAILCYDIDGVCTYASPSVVRVLGRAPDEFLGKRATDAMHPESAVAIADVERRLLSGESDHERFTYRTMKDDAEGRPVHIEANCAIASSGEERSRQGIIVCARDVSERVRLEQQLVDTRRKAEGAAQAKSQFLADMSQEIRTPMNGVLGFAELLQKTDLPPAQARYADIIAHSGRSMMAILNDILDISKIEAGVISIEKLPVDVPRLLEDCASVHRSTIEGKGLALEVILDPAMPRCVSVDPLRLRQVVGNLLTNAAKFTSHGKIAVALKYQGDTFTICVSDTGVGIAKERIDSIFEPFVHSDQDTSRVSGGTGLGLSISQQLTGKMGGTLDVESTQGLGSRFCISLPCHEVPSTTTHERRAHQVEQSLHFPAAGRVLLAEDHDVTRMLTREMLNSCNLTVETALDGNQAVDMVLDAEHADRPFALVLMDVQMPDCDGYEATRSIRLAGLTAEHLPIIAITAPAFGNDMSTARAAGMQAYLAKPVVFEELKAALNRWLPHRIVGEDREVDFRWRTTAVEAHWRKRREQALDAAREALAEDELSSDQGRDIAVLLHKLAGSAGMFGEDELGKHAATLAHALRTGAAPSLRQQLARKLIETA